MTTKEKARVEAGRINTHAKNNNTKLRQLIANLAAHPSLIVIRAWVRSRWSKSAGGAK